MRLLILVCVSAVAASIFLSGQASAQSEPLPAAQVKFFEARIRPVLVEHCYTCHSADSRELGGGLQVDGRDALLKGGDSGPALVPGRPEASLIVKAIRQSDRDLIMPPKDSGKKLSDKVIADFEQWIRQGAIDPRTNAPSPSKKKHDPAAAKSWWAWQPVRSTQPPAVEDEAWCRDPLDRFILAKLEREGMKPNRDCDPATLVRRIAFDLTGLPPSVSELYDFALSETPKPLDELVDRYLDSTAYGERMGRRWLDVARYAESAGKDLNGMFPHAWRYRDYVIDAFNNDTSYRTFITEQLAGDLLPSRSADEKARRTIATGFLAIGPKGLNEMNPRQFAADLADEQIDTLSQAFMGLTIACARCHDHKFDPISQRDYTAMAGIFLSTETHFGSQGGVGGRNRTTLITLPDSFADLENDAPMPKVELEAKRARLEQLREEQRALLAERARERQAGGDAGNPGRDFLRVQQQMVTLETELAQFNADGSRRALAMGVSDKPPSTLRGALAQRPGLGRPGLGRPGLGFRPMPPGVQRPQRGALPPELQMINDSALLERGEIDKPGERVPRGLPVFFAPGEKPLASPVTSGRLELAQWIGNESNPLTARVMVNRIWSWTMGRGIVASVDNFGSTGDLPSHPELLDYLAGEFVYTDWSVKKLIRRIVLSHSYALASDFQEENFARDPDNQFFWRANVRMLEAEAVRDAMLSAAGTLDVTRPHGSVISRAGDGVIGGRPNAPRQNGLSEEQITKVSATYRSVYLPLPRNVLPDALELFDFPDNSMVHGSRETTLVPNQALYWMNSQAVDRAAGRIALRLFPGQETFANVPKRFATGDQQGKPTADDASVAYAQNREVNVPMKFENLCLLTLSRLPLEDELAAAQRFIDEQSQQGASQQEIWTSLCRAMISSADFRRLR